MNELFTIYVMLVIIKAVLLFSDVWGIVKYKTIDSEDYTPFSRVLLFVFSYMITVILLPLTVLFYLMGEKFKFFMAKTDKELEIIVKE